MISFKTQIIETFSEDIPVQAESGVVSKRTDPKCLHKRLILTLSNNAWYVKLEINWVKVISDGTDVFVLLTVYVFWQGSKSKKVICDDTDVFVLLTVYVFWKVSKSKVLMEVFGISH